MKTYLPIIVAVIFMFVLSAVALPAWSADIPFEFENPQQGKRYDELVNQLRCLVCQNQTLADSHADLAQDLRNEVYKMVKEGTSKQQIIDYLVARYGDFVLYNPPLKNTTLILWFGPFILLVVAVVIALKFVRSRADAEVTELDAEQRKKLKRLLKKNLEKSK